MAIQVDVRDEVRAAVEAAIPRVVEAVVAAVRGATADRLVTVVEAAGILGCSPAAVRKRIERGSSLKAIRHGRSVRLKMSDLIASVPSGDREDAG